MTERLSEVRQAFLHDVREWREASGFSLRELSRKTMIEREALVAFEQTGHFNNPIFNRVYLRSMAGMYAKSIGLDVGAMHEALDQALDNSYDGMLGRLRRGEPLAMSDKIEQKVPAATASEKPRPSDPGPSVGVRRPRRSPYRHRRPHFNARNTLVGGGALVGILVVIAALVFVLRPNQQILPAEGELQLPTALEDTAATDQVALSDSFYVIVHAARQKIEGAAVITDDEEERRCWIERGEAKAFAVNDSLRVQGRLGRMRLYAAGYEVPVDTAGASLVVTRSQIEAADWAVAPVVAIIDTVSLDPAHGCGRVQPSAVLP